MTYYQILITISGNKNRETTEGNYTITSLNIGQDKCIKILEHGAEILYCCDDKAL